MILINKGEVNQVVLTLSERTTITDACYLFEFIKDGSIGSVIYFIATDVSLNKLRYNQFSIEENSVADVLNGVITLDVCDYKYTVYEQVDGSTNLDPTGLNVVEFGRVQVKQVQTDLAEFNSQQTIIKEFNG
jgi:hypothetical protein